MVHVSLRSSAVMWTLTVAARDPERYWMSSPTAAQPPTGAQRLSSERTAVSTLLPEFVMKLWSTLWLRIPTQSSRPAAPSSVRAQI